MYISNAFLEEMSYANDRRNSRVWYDAFDERTMTAVVDGEKVRCKYVVCDLCNGKGSHVNPSIDCGGLTAEDFEADPGFAEDYFDGTFDQQCNHCHGK